MENITTCFSSPLLELYTMPAVAKSSRQTKTKPPRKPVILSAKSVDKSSNKQEQRNEKGIIYVKHLPHGFFENQLRTFFSQFGDVTRVHVARSKKTLRSRGYAYVEFRYREVAQIAAETMNNYLMFGKILKTDILPAGAKRIPRKYEKAFDSNGNETSTYKLWLKRMVSKSNGRVTKTKVVNRNNRALAKLKQLKQRYAETGVDYDVAAVIPDFIQSDVMKPISDADEERSKAKKKKSSEQKRADTLETFLKNVKSQESEQDSSEEDQDISFAALENDDWDAPESDSEDKLQKQFSKKGKLIAIKQASKAKRTLCKEKKSALEKLSERLSPIPKSGQMVTKKQTSQSAGKPLPSNKKTQNTTQAQENAICKSRVNKQSRVKTRKPKIKDVASSPVKKAAKELLQDPSVRKVKGKDINKKKKVK